MNLIVETFQAKGENSISKIRVRPLQGQGINTNIRVECSKAMRTAYPVGQKFLIAATLTHKASGAEYLSSNFRDKWHPVSDVEAVNFIEKIFKK